MTWQVFEQEVGDDGPTRLPPQPVGPRFRDEHESLAKGLARDLNENETKNGFAPSGVFEAVKIA